MRKICVPAITALMFAASITTVAAQPPEHGGSNAQAYHRDHRKDSRDHPQQHENHVIHHEHRVTHRAEHAVEHAHHVIHREHRAIHREYHAAEHAHYAIHREHRLSHEQFKHWRRNVYAHHRFHWHVYHHPRGWYPHHWVFGEFLPHAWWVRDYWIDDWSAFDLAAPPFGYVWVRVGDDALLIDTDTGEILRVVYGVFY